MKYSPILICLLMLLSCSKDSVNPGVKIIGHGISGFGLFNQYYPDNSKSGLAYALSFEKLDAIEVDIQLTKDSLFVCFHDDFLEERTSGIGDVSQYTLEELLAFKYLSFPEENIMSFEELISHDLSGVEVFLNVKSNLDLDPLESEWFVQLIENAILSIDCEKVAVLLENKTILQKINGNIADRYLHVLEFNQGSLDVVDFEYEGVVSRNTVLNNDEWLFFKEKGLKSVIFEVKASSSFYDALEKQTDYIMVEDIVKGLEFK